MTPIISDLIESSVGKTVQGLIDRFLPKSATEVEKQTFAHDAKKLIQGDYQMVAKNIESARDLHAKALKDAPKWIKAASAVVIPYGGLMAITVFFWNILAPYFGFVRINLTLHESLTIDTIITFFFGYRLTQKLKGTAGKF